MAGESAQREFERRRARRQARLQTPRARALAFGLVVASFGLGALIPVLPLLIVDGSEIRFGTPSLLIGLMLAAATAIRVLAPPQSETAWRRGAEGERIVARALASLTEEGGRVLHDRRIPRSRANIDHLVVTSAGVFTVDAKRYAGKLETRRGGRELWIAGRNRTKLLDQARRQAAAVSMALREDGLAVPVRPALCFVDTEMPWLFAPRAIGDVLITTPRTVRKRLGDGDRLTRDAVARAADLLDRRFPPAASPAVKQHAPRPPDRRPSATPTPPTSPPAGQSPPVCRCGAQMVRRSRRSDGAAFYGCSTFPACRRTRAIGG